jgi:glycosyltransferase involved in cell wall biosynthesis
MTTLYEQLLPWMTGKAGADSSSAGQSADVERGVVLKGPWETFGDGFSEHTRRNARALALAGVPVALRSVSPRVRIAVDDELTIDRDYADLLHRTISTVAAQVIQIIPHEGNFTPFVTHRYYSVDELRAINSRMAFYAVWERMAGLRQDDREALALVGQVWVGCNATKAFLCSEGVDEAKVRVFGCPYLPDDPYLKLRGRAKQPGRPRFYTIGKWEPRKDQHRMLGAFLRAFKPGQATLFVKTSARAPFFENYPHSIGASQEEWLRDDLVKAQGWTAENVGRDVIVATKHISAEAIVALHRLSDCYVSLSRGEGFDMPSFDAKLAGNLLLYTPSGGPQDFAHPNDVRVEASGLVDAHPHYNWVAGSKYLDWDLDAAVEGFRLAAARIQGKIECAPDLTAFGALEVGKRMAASLAEMGDLRLSQVTP